MSKFINIQDSRIVLTSIKRYKPLNEVTLVIYYTSSRQKIDNEMFTFQTEEERNEMLSILDTALGCYGIKTKRLKRPTNPSSKPKE